MQRTHAGAQRESKRAPLRQRSHAGGQNNDGNDKYRGVAAEWPRWKWIAVLSTAFVVIFFLAYLQKGGRQRSATITGRGVRRRATLDNNWSSERRISDLWDWADVNDDKLIDRHELERWNWITSPNTKKPSASQFEKILRERYSELLSELETDHLNPQVFARFYKDRKRKLSKHYELLFGEEMSRIWNWADENVDGKLSAEELLRLVWMTTGHKGDPRVGAVRESTLKFFEEHWAGSDYELSQKDLKMHEMSRDIFAKHYSVSKDVKHDYEVIFNEAVPGDVNQIMKEILKQKS